ncbi:MAG: flagellar hook capping FlgD N-terminal domain-containing protein [Longimicrobiales bacterium]
MNVAGVGSGSAADLTRATGGATMGKEEFLQLLVAQLKNQDPLNPSNPEEMASQLAQFSSLEQLVNVNDQLAAQTESNALMASALNNSTAVGMLGKTVLAAGDGVTVTGSGKESVTVGVAGVGGNATLTLYAPDGTEVGSRQVGPVGGGRQEIELGTLADGLEPGRYRYELTVEGQEGQPIQVQAFESTRIDGVRYGPSGPVLVSGGREISLADVVEIISQAPDLNP